MSTTSRRRAKADSLNHTLAAWPYAANVMEIITTYLLVDVKIERMFIEMSVQWL